MTRVDQDIHHLSDTEAMPEIMERVVAITTMHSRLLKKKEEKNVKMAKNLLNRSIFQKGHSITT